MIRSMTRLASIRVFGAIILSAAAPALFKAQTPTHAPGTPGPDGVYTMGPGMTLPKPISMVQADPTEVARKLGMKGKVTLQFVVGADGTAHDVKVLRSLGLG